MEHSHKLKVAQTVKKYAAFYGTNGFTVVFTRNHQRPLHVAS
jgi:hypothetical protein